MKVFLAGTSLHPSYGGPAYSVSRLATALSAMGAQIGLWTPDESVATSPLLAADSPVLRLTGPAARALDSFGQADVLHDNGLWRSHNHRLAQLAGARGIARVVSTRGMLEPWAMHHKRWKKRVAWPLYQRRDLMQAGCLHATTDAEAANLQRCGLRVPVRVIPNGVDLPSVDPTMVHPKPGGMKTALFLGRLYPVKGLPMLVEAWARVRPEGWRLTIAGPDEGGHRREIERQVSAAGLDRFVQFEGLLADDAKRSHLLNADLFVLPTHSESFGMVVAEALAHGLPVLTTTAAPWPTLEKHNCGWRVEPNVDGLTHGLRHATSCDSGSLSRMGANGRDLVASEFQWRHVAEQVVAMYRDLRR